MLLRRGAAAAAALVVAAAAAVAIGPLAAPAGAAEGPECGSGTAGEVTGPNTVYDQLDVAAAAAAAPAAALRSVQVVVVAPRLDAWADDIAAGIVDGAPTSTGQHVGIAPGVPVSVIGYGTDQEATSPQLAAALRTINPQGHTIVLVQGTVRPSAELTGALRRLRGALVVAPIGDAPGSSSDPVVGDLYRESDTTPAQDAVGRVAPASDDAVLAVGVAGWSYADRRPLLNSDVDVAAPVGGGISSAPGPCVVPGVRTDWAAAEVAGVAALTWAALPHQSVDQLRSRLEQTADGGGGEPQGNTVGYGVVQPLAAVTLSPKALKGAGPADPVQRRAAPPDGPADVLAGTRRAALWWGLVGGGALAVALLLRPLLSRRRT